jgi:hypothetical protein
LVLGQDQGFSKDPTQVVKELTEAPNQGSEAFDTPAPTPTQEGKPRTYPTTLFTLQSTSIYLHLCITSRSCNENPRCIDTRNQCIEPESITARCSAK